MKQDEMINEQELERMESNLRSMTSAIDSDAPDQRYWANFRVRVIDTIEQKQERKQRSIFASVSEWFSDSALRAFAVSTAIVILALGSFMIFNQSNDIPQLAATQTVTQPATVSVTTTPQVQTTTEQPVTIAANSTTTKKILSTTKETNYAAVPKNSLKEKIINETGDFSSYDQTLSVGSIDDPIDYSTLTESELESVISTIRTMN